MSLYIVFRPKERELIEWHTGEPIAFSPYEVDNVMAVQAADNELEYLCERFPSVLRDLPRRTGPEGTIRYVRVARWFGDDAKFIVGNLT